MKAGSDAASSAAIPAAVASVQIACPLETPTAVNTPARRPPRSEFRIVSAVSGPGVTITIAETPRKAASWPATAPVSQTRAVRHRRDTGDVIREELTLIMTWEERHRRLLARLAIVLMATLALDALGLGPRLSPRAQR